MIEQAWNYKSVVAKDSNNTEVGSVSKYAPRYFKIDWDKAAYDWFKVLTPYESAGYSNYNQLFAASYKVYNEVILILPITCINIGVSNDMIIAFSYIPNYAAAFVDNNLDYAKLNSFEEIIQALSARFDISMEGITEITEDEYYKID